MTVLTLQSTTADRQASPVYPSLPPTPATPPGQGWWSGIWDLGSWSWGLGWRSGILTAIVHDQPCDVPVQGLTIVKTRKTLFFWMNFYKKEFLTWPFSQRVFELFQTEYKQKALLDTRYILYVEVRFVGTVGNLDPVNIPCCVSISRKQHVNWIFWYEQ